MKLSDMIVDDGIVVPLASDDLLGGLEELMARIAKAGHVTEEGAIELAAALADRSRGDHRSIDEDALIVWDRVEGLGEIVAAIGVPASPVEASDTSLSPPVLVLLLTPLQSARMERGFIPALGRELSAALEGGLRSARSAEEVSELEGLMGVQLGTTPLVREAMTPLQYRVYPETPLDEVVDLMIRRKLDAIPVVGASLELLGIVSVGDALSCLLPLRRSEDSDRPSRTAADARHRREHDAGEGALEAREMMTRSVMCVAEDLSLYEAANLMANRDVEQLPVVREGELVGFVTRYSILKLLFDE